MPPTDTRALFRPVSSALVTLLAEPLLRARSVIV
jgi:hypothetical protein